MKRTTSYAVIIAAILGGAVAVPAIAQNADGHGDRAEAHRDDRGGSRHNRMGNMQRMTSLMALYDTDGDGSITQDEIDAARTASLAEFDTDADSQLTLDEYQALWLDAMRDRMVDRFQAHDDDGDGLVTIEEFNEEFAGLVERLDRNEDGAVNADDRMVRGNGHAGPRPGPQEPAESE
jgi:hypothetical protein